MGKHTAMGRYWRYVPAAACLVLVLVAAIRIIWFDTDPAAQTAPSASPTATATKAPTASSTSTVLPVKPVATPKATPTPVSVKAQPGQPPTDPKPKVKARVRYVTVYTDTRYVRTKPTTAGNEPVSVVYRGQRVATVALVRSQDPYHDGRPYWVKLPGGRFMWAGSTNALSQYHQQARPSRSKLTGNAPQLAHQVPKVVKTAKVVKVKPRPAVRHYMLPVAHYRLTARFGERGSWSLGYHTGLDFAAPTGTPVRAVAAGRVTHGYDRYFGREAILHLANGREMIYAHLSGYARSGHVRAGDIIGYIGTSGRTTGPHLHLEYRPDGGGFGSGRNPLGWFRAHGLHVPARK